MAKSKCFKLGTYKQPIIKAVSFRVERGFTGSSDTDNPTTQIYYESDILLLQNNENANQQYNRIGANGDNSWF